MNFRKYDPLTFISALDISIEFKKTKKKTIILKNVVI